MALLALLATPAAAADADLAALSAALAHVRATKATNAERDAGPELTPVKHLLRAWVEKRLPVTAWPPTAEHPVTEPTAADFNALSRTLNAALEAADLTCQPKNPAERRCLKNDEEDDRGYLGGVTVSSLDEGRYILLTTDVGVHCGFDESAYIYARGPKGNWRLLFETEQDRYGEKAYAPQNFLSISVSPAQVAWTAPAPPPLVVTLGYSPWCYSNWQALYTRLWRTTAATPDPRPLLDRLDGLYTGDDFSAGASLSDSDLLVEWEGDSVDAGILIRKHLRHYLIGPGDRLRRIAPLAFNPSDFVDEWLASDWTTAARWTAAGADRAALAKSHPRSRDFSGAFDGPAKRCRSDPTLWQVAFAANKGLRFEPDRYYLVRWLPPYRFTLDRVAAKAFAGCDETPAMPDNIGTFFSQEGWPDGGD